MGVTIEQLWQRFGFSPNEQQRQAILHTEGPLFLTAGPGSGKTRTILWRTVNLIVFHEVPPEEIYLATFTEKAARQLQRGLTAYLAEASVLTGRHYDLSRMLLGTVHSTCRRILTDRRFSRGYERPRRLVLLDELDQYFWLCDHWKALAAAAGWERAAAEKIIGYIDERKSRSRHQAAACLQALFNRFSEEFLDPQKAAKKAKDTLRYLLRMYEEYCRQDVVDLSLLQVRALQHLRQNSQSSTVLRYLIIDEYQDTNYVQEQLFFHLARGHKNLCVVGDDDQALYRFRGSTVENLVQFPERCERYLGVRPATIHLGVNYRSRPAIVELYKKFMGEIDWRKPHGRGYYRVMGKRLEAHRTEDGPAVVVTDRVEPQAVCQQVARLVRQLVDTGKVADPNQIAFLYPSLKSRYVQRMIEALENVGLQVYAPRAGRFLEQDEPRSVLGMFQLLLEDFNLDGQHVVSHYQNWLDSARDSAKPIARADRLLARFLADTQKQLQTVAHDYELLHRTLGNEATEYLSEDHVRRLRRLAGLSDRAKRYLRRGLPRLRAARASSGRPVTLNYVIARMTTLDWGLLDLFYQLMGFKHFKKAFDDAQTGRDEGPICNLAMLSRYLARYQTRTSPLIGGRVLSTGWLWRDFFNSYIYGLWRRKETEYEDEETPFPSGRIPFLTIHQAKGLEFPVVVLGNVRTNRSVPRLEEIARELVGDRQREPLGRVPEFDAARLFYVAMSRAKNLLIICRYRGQGSALNEHFAKLFDRGAIPPLRQLDLDSIPSAPREEEDELPKAYSYTGDYLAYRACPRRYMVYRRYGFAPARAQRMVFGTLVHRTIEDLHYWVRGQQQAGRRFA